MINQLINVIVAPTVAFSALKEKPSILFPLLIVLVASVTPAISVIYLGDFDYLIQQTAIQQAEMLNVPVSEMSQNMQGVTPLRLALSSVIPLCIVLPLIYCIYAGVMYLITKLTDDEELTFRHFFSLMCWASIPVVISALATLVNVLLSADGQFASAAAANPLNFNNLVLGGNGGAALDNVDLTNIWGLGLMIIGYKSLTGSGWVKAVLVPLALPIIVISIGFLISLIF